MILSISLSAGVLLFCTVLLLFGEKAREQEEVDERLRQIGLNGGNILFRDYRSRKPFTGRVLVPMIRRLSRMMPLIYPVKAGSSADFDKQKKMLMQSGWTVSMEEYLTVRLILMVSAGTGLFVLCLVLGRGIMDAVLYFLLGAFSAYALVRVLCSRAAAGRKKRMERQLPDLLDLLGVSVEAGLGFERALQHVTESMEGPLVDEFSVCSREMGMGRSRKDALLMLNERCGIEDLDSVVSAIIQAGQLGIPIRSILRSQAAAVRRSRKNKAQEQASKVSTRILLPLMLFIFPSLLVVLLGPSLLNLVDVLNK